MMATLLVNFAPREDEDGEHKKNVLSMYMRNVMSLQTKKAHEFVLGANNRHFRAQTGTYDQSISPEEDEVN